MSHTPGPWKITESANAIVVMGPNAQHVVIIPLFKEYAWSKEEWEGLNLEEKNKVSIANARLVAAAPELLEELREMLEYTRILRSFYLDDEDLRGKGTMIEEDIERVEALLKRVEKGGA